MKKPAELAQHIFNTEVIPLNDVRVEIDEDKKKEIKERIIKSFEDAGNMGKVFLNNFINEFNSLITSYIGENPDFLSEYLEEKRLQFSAADGTIKKLRLRNLVIEFVLD